MKILRKIMYGILLLFMLCCGVIILCAVKPELSAKIADVLKLNEPEYGMSSGAEKGYVPEEVIGP